MTFRTLLTPPGPPDYNAYFETVLNVSGALLGLGFSALLFVLSSGFRDFQYSRRMFLEIYVKAGVLLLTSLAGVVVIALFSLYFTTQPSFLTVTCYTIVILWGKALLDLNERYGYMHTLNSKEFVPATYGPMRAYIRYIGNLGLFRWLVTVAVFGVVALYPTHLAVYGDESPHFTGVAAFYLTIFLLIYSLIRILRFIPEFFRFTGMEYEATSGKPIASADPENRQNIDFAGERAVLQEYLVDHGYLELDPSEGREFLGGLLTVVMPSREGEPDAWFNINLDLPATPLPKIRAAILEYGYEMLEAFEKSPTDITEVVLSFHVTIENDHVPDEPFFRTTRTEIGRLRRVNSNPRDFMLAIRNKLILGVFRD